MSDWQQRLRDATSQAVFLRTEQPLLFIAHSLLADAPVAPKAESTADYVARHRIQERLEEAITSLHPSSMDDPRLERELAQALIIQALPKAEGGKLGVLSERGGPGSGGATDPSAGPTETQIEAFLQKVGEPSVESLARKDAFKWQGKRVNDEDCMTFAPGFMRMASAGMLGGLLTIELFMNAIGDKGLTALAAVFPDLPALRNLLLNSNRFGFGGLKAMTEAIGAGALPQLLHLDISHNKVGDQGMRLLAEALGKGALQLERLTCNAFRSDALKVGDAGLRSLAGVLSKGAALKKLAALDLQGNEIGDDGLSALAAPLKEGALPALQRLHMPKNKVGDAGLRALAGALGDGALKNLTYLSLGDGVGDLAPLAEALSRGGAPKLKTLQLADGVGDAGVIALLGAPAVLTTLESLTLGGKMGAAGLDAVTAAVPKFEALKKLVVPEPYAADAKLAELCAAKGIETPSEANPAAVQGFGLAGKTLLMYNRFSSQGM